VEFDWFDDSDVYYETYAKHIFEDFDEVFGYAHHRVQNVPEQIIYETMVEVVSACCALSPKGNPRP